MTERLYRGLLHLYPARFRARFADDMAQLFGDQIRGARTEGQPAAVIATWLRAITDLLATAASEHIRRNRTVAHSLAASPSFSSRLLGILGVAGGILLVAALVVDIAPDINFLRLILFSIGAMAVILAVHRRQVAVAPRTALLASVPALLANAWFVAWLLISPPAEFRLIGFYTELALWLGNAFFGLVALRLGMVTRWGALALAIGSVLAILGMDRLELTSPSNPTIFGTLALAGIALNGIGWILLGLDVATRRRAIVAQPEGASPRG